MWRMAAYVLVVVVTYLILNHLWIHADPLEMSLPRSAKGLGAVGVFSVISLVVGCIEFAAVTGRIPSRTSSVAGGATSFAARLAGRRRALHGAWLADLAGDPESGRVLSRGEQRRLAAGFVVASLRMRAHDFLGWAWSPVDWLLAVDSRVNAAVALAVGAQVIYIVHGDGLHALLTEGWGWCAGCGVALRLLCGWLRRVRGIEIASPGRPPVE